jgi:hypothetical protein
MKHENKKKYAGSSTGVLSRGKILSPDWIGRK